MAPPLSALNGRENAGLGEHRIEGALVGDRRVLLAQHARDFAWYFWGFCVHRPGGRSTLNSSSPRGHGPLRSPPSRGRERPDLVAQEGHQRRREIRPRLKGALVRGPQHAMDPIRHRRRRRLDPGRAGRDPSRRCRPGPRGRNHRRPAGGRRTGRAGRGGGRRAGPARP